MLSHWNTTNKLAFLGLLLVNVPQRAVEATEYYRKDFQNTSDPLTEWSVTSTESTPGTPLHASDRFLGRFIGAGNCVMLTLNNLPTHHVLSLRFDLYIIHSWDGNNSSDGGPDKWTLKAHDIGGVSGVTTLMHTTFANNIQPGDPDHWKQDYPDDYPSGMHPAYDGAAEVHTLGYPAPCCGFTYEDAVYRFDAGNAERQFVFAHSAPTLKVEFCSDTRYGITPDESWGIDNVVISDSAVPAVSSWGLAILLLGILAIGSSIVLRKAAPAPVTTH